MISPFAKLGNHFSDAYYFLKLLIALGLLAYIYV